MPTVPYSRPSQIPADPLSALVSIHDVMPHNLHKIDNCLSYLERHKIHTCYLLVVPGLNWDRDSLQRLRQYVADGHILVAHGWVHKAEHITGVYHRLHSQLISRDVAEHLCRNKLESISLLRRSRTWFADNLLPVPDYYVPPAWALGNLNQHDLKRTGFNYVEVTTGIFDLRQDKFHYLPLVGFETDSLFRAASVRLSNMVNLSIARVLRGRSLRVAVHPDDFELYLSSSLCEILNCINEQSIETALRANRRHSLMKA